MTVKDIQKFANEQYNMVLTDAEAQKVLEDCVNEGAVSEEELGKVSGGISGQMGEMLSEVFAKIRERIKNNDRH